MEEAFRREGDGREERRRATSQRGHRRPASIRPKLLGLCCPRGMLPRPGLWRPGFPKEKGTAARAEGVGTERAVGTDGATPPGAPWIQVRFSGGQSCVLPAHKWLVLLTRSSLTRPTRLAKSAEPRTPELYFPY